MILQAISPENPHINDVGFAELDELDGLEIETNQAQLDELDALDYLDVTQDAKDE